MRIDPNAQAHTSIEQYDKGDIDNATAKEEDSESKAASNEEKEKEEAKDSAPANDSESSAKEAGVEVKPETPTVAPTLGSAETALGTSNPGSAMHTPDAPSGVPAPHATPVPVPPNAASAENESVIEERGEVSMLYVGRVIGKGGEVSFLNRISLFGYIFL